MTKHLDPTDGGQRIRGSEDQGFYGGAGDSNQKLRGGGIDGTQRTLGAGDSC